jgi:hypothetical protein
VSTAAILSVAVVDDPVVAQTDSTASSSGDDEESSTAMIAGIVVAVVVIAAAVAYKSYRRKCSVSPDSAGPATDTHAGRGKEVISANAVEQAVADYSDAKPMRVV